MKRKLSLMMLALVLTLILSLGLVACGGGNSDSTTNDSSNVDDGLLQFEGISFENASLDYDGQEHEILVSGELNGATVTYTNNKGTNAGVYNATAKITKEGYKTLNLSAVLTINKIDMSDTLKMTNKTVDYNESKHSIVVEGTLPENASIVYAGGEDNLNGATAAGTYTITAKISAPNYNDKNLSATLTINKIDMSDTIVFNNQKFEYDTQEHKITISGTVPKGASIVYTGGENGTNGATSVGVYDITATITATNYNTLVLKAKLTIDTKEEDLNVVLYNNVLYFQNPLDKNYLYSYDDTTVSKVSRDCPIAYVEANGKLYFLSKGLLATSICSFDGTKTETLFEVTGDNLATDGINLYYVNNSIINPDETGIYKVKIADIENQNCDPIPTRIAANKADNLVYNNGYIYFANKADEKKLYRISINATNGTATKVYDYKISEMIVKNGVLYFTRHNNLTAAIYKIDLSSNPAMPILDDSSYVTKITASKGKDLTVIGDYIYFINTDMATSTIYGDGIYKAKIDGSGWVGDAFQTLIGATKVVDAKENNVYALTGNSNTLYYYKHNDKHLYSFSIASEQESDVMADFEPPVYKELITTYYEKTLVYENEIYYINMKDGGRLYKYNIDNGSEFRITGLQVADFTIHDNYLYYASVRFMVNFDLYKVNLTNGESTRISVDKCYNLAFDTDWIYYLNFSGSNTLNRMKYDGTAVEVLYDTKGVDDLPIEIKNGLLYFTSDKVLYTYNLSTKEVKALTAKKVNVDDAFITDSVYVIINDKLTENTIEIYDINTNELLNVISLGATDDARGFIVKYNEMYFYRNNTVASSKKGLYKVNLKTKDAKAVLVDNMTREDVIYYCSNIQIVGNKIYFMNIWQVANSVPEPNYSTGDLCVYDLGTKGISKLN